MYCIKIPFGVDDGIDAGALTDDPVDVVGVSAGALVAHQHGCAGVRAGLDNDGAKRRDVCACTGHSDGDCVVELDVCWHRYQGGVFGGGPRLGGDAVDGGSGGGHAVVVKRNLLNGDLRRSVNCDLGGSLRRELAVVQAAQAT